MSETSREQEIRELAFHLWQKAGEPQGQQDEFWHAAVKQLDGGPRSTDADTSDSFPASDPPSNSGITGIKT